MWVCSFLVSNKKGTCSAWHISNRTKLYFSTWLLRRSFTCASGVGEMIEYHVYVHLFFNARAHNVAREVCMSGCLGQQTPTGVIALERQVENKNNRLTGDIGVISKRPGTVYASQVPYKLPGVVHLRTLRRLGGEGRRRLLSCCCNRITRLNSLQKECA